MDDVAPDSQNGNMTKQTIIFNIGGVVFETYRSTLLRLPDGPLANRTFLEKNHRSERNDYFFDRDPDAFRVVLNYLRTGQLYIPPNTGAGADMKNELLFWGLMPNVIERWCLTNEPKTAIRTRNQAEHDQVGSNSKLTVIWNVLSNPWTSVGAKVYAFVSYIFIVLSIFSLIAATTSPFQQSFRVVVMKARGNMTTDISRVISITHPTLTILDFICLLFFTVEYLVRVVTAPRKLRFVLSFLGVIDFLALVPGYIGLLAIVGHKMGFPIMFDWQMLTIFCILRIFRICRLLKSVPGMKILICTLRASVVELVFLICLLAVGVLVFATLIHAAEKEVGQQIGFRNIPAAFWWAIVTMTTVGYGDICPQTALGKVVGSLCSISGVVLIGLSVSVLVNNAMFHYKHMFSALGNAALECKAPSSCYQVTSCTSECDARGQECVPLVSANIRNGDRSEK